MFGLSLHNIPLINLRSEFNLYSDLFSGEDFRDQFKTTRYKEISLPNMDWGGNHDTLLTMLLQRAIVGIESYIPAAIMVEAGRRGCLERGDFEFLKNPYNLGGRGTVDNYYHRLPSQLCKDFSLKVYDSILWKKNIAFYREVRNPLFHGQEIESKCVDGVYQSYMHIQDLYNWIDSWHDPNNILPGFRNISTNRKWRKGNDRKGEQ
jgi:hypothetical protein